MYRQLLAVSVAVGMIACTDMPDSSVAPTEPTIMQGKVRNEWVPHSQWLPNHCTGESMWFEGKRKFLETNTEDGAGGYHWSFHRNWKGTATGDSTGNVYNINYPINWTENAKPPYPYTVQQVWYNNATCRGKCPTMLFRSWYHITINANGEITSERDEASIECPGS